MKQLLVFVVLLLTTASLHAGSLDKSLKRLDRTVANSAAYVQKKQAEIDRLKGNMNVAVNITDRYLSCKQIAEAYIKFDSDSALVYWGKCYGMGERAGKREWMQEAVINEAYVEADRGDSFASIWKIRLLPFEDVVPYLRGDYAKAYLLCYLNYVPTGISQPLAPEDMQKTWRQYQRYISRDDPEYYVHELNMVPSVDKSAVERKIRQLCRRYRNDDRKLALCYFTLALIYRQNHQEEKSIEMTILATEADIRSANRSSQAIITVIEYLNEKDVRHQADRILNYLKLAEEDVATYKDISRSVRLVNVLSNVTKVYQKQSGQRRALYIIVTVLLVLLLLRFVCLYDKTRRSLHTYTDEDHDDKARIRDLSAVVSAKDQEIERLQARVGEQDRRLGAMDDALVKPFALLGMLVKDVRVYKKDINRMLAANMLHDAKRLAGSSLAKDQAVEMLYQQFDEAFLALHPDFVSRFNHLLRPEAQIRPEENGRLTPELRIFALVSLGLDDSASIAEILQYSTQTVYNYRLKVRKGAVDHEQKFANAVRALYGQETEGQ